ncbi:MAG: hypothetical protein H3C26_20295 [Rhodocyclaceae bacterium]|nr:hypothetical protein [Rhodocyclaceae bacterium]
MTPPLLRLPLETLLGFSHDGRAFRSFDHLIFAGAGSLLLAPAWSVSGDLRQVVDGCPVPWEEVFDVLDAPPHGVEVLAQEVPAALRALAADGWQAQVFRMSRRQRSTRRFVHQSGIRYADLR